MLDAFIWNVCIIKKLFYIAPEIRIQNKLKLREHAGHGTGHINENVFMDCLSLFWSDGSTHTACKIIFESPNIMKSK